MKPLRRFGWCWLLVLTVPHAIRAQVPYPPSVDPARSPAATRSALPGRDPTSLFRDQLSPDPFAPFSQLPKPPNAPTAVSEQQSKQAQVERERIRIVRCKDFVQSAMRADKQRVSVALRDHQRLEGFIISATPEQFVIRSLSSQQEHSIRYEDVAKWRVIRSPGEQARHVGQTVGLILLAIPLLPLMLLAG